MAKISEIDQSLTTLPSLPAVKAFLAAARHQSFTRAAQVLCVTQGAISRQIRALEGHLNAELFTRSGRSVQLTEAGLAFFDVVQQSLTNIFQAAERIRVSDNRRHAVSLACSHAFARFLAGPSVVGLFSATP